MCLCKLAIMGTSRYVAARKTELWASVVKVLKAQRGADVVLAARGMTYRVISRYPAQFENRSYRSLAAYSNLHTSTIQCSAKMKHLACYAFQCFLSYFAIMPPSTTNDMPQQKSLALLARKITAPLKSSGKPHRPAGVRSMMYLVYSAFSV